MSYCFKVIGVEAFKGNQVVIWLASEADGSTDNPHGGKYAVRVRADAIGPFVRDLLDAQSATLANIMLDVAAGGCRTCSNTRKINVDHLTSLAADGGGEPCPVCVPRATDRLRKAAHLPPIGDER